MLLRTLIDEARRTVSILYPEGEASEMVFALLEHLLGTKRHTHVVEPSYEVSEDKISEVMNAVARLAAGEPLQYVIGSASFYGRDFNVSPAVLIPRPETEILCRTAVQAFSGYKAKDAGGRVLDLCTGSGCIAWTLALECPGIETVAVDISAAALALASSQDFSGEIRRTGATVPIFLKADVLAEVPSEKALSHGFDMILSNPPYVMDKEKALMRSNVLEHEPHLALFVPDEDPLLFYRAVARWASALLLPDGFGMVEINEALGQETAQVFVEAGFVSAEVMQDFSGRDRFILFSRKSSTEVPWNNLSEI